MNKTTSADPIEIAHYTGALKAVEDYELDYEVECKWPFECDCDTCLQIYEETWEATTGR